MKISKRLLTSIVMLAVLVAVVCIKNVVLNRRQQAVKLGVTDAPSLKSKGDPSAPVKIVEFTDFQCPACAKGADVVEEFLAKYPGKIHFEMKYFPLSMHQHALRAAVYAQCVGGQGKFWPFYQVLFKSQSSWNKMTAVDSYFSELAVSLGADGVALAACVNDPKTVEIVEKDASDGMAIGVSSTPTFFVNGTMVVGVKLFRDEMDKALKSQEE